MDEHLQHAPIGVVETTSDGSVVDVNERAAELLDVSPSLAETTAGEVLPRAASGSLSEAFADGDVAERSFEEYYPGIDCWLAVDVVPADNGVLVYLRDRSSHRERRQQVDALQRRLDRMETIDALVGTVLQQVIDASDREEVARTVCDGLGTTALYEFAWLGEHDPASDHLRVVASAGDAPALRDQIVDELGSEASLPEQAAVVNEQTRIVQPIADDDAIPQSVRLAAFSRGLQSCLAVPLAYRGTVYGVLGVYAARETGFSGQERASLETLGAVAGFAINAIRQEDLLFADTVTELELEVSDPAVPLVSAASEADCTLTLAGAVPRENGRVLCYVHADAAADAAVDALARHDDVAGTRRIDTGDHVFEVELAGDSPVATLTRLGTTVSSATFESGTARLAAELPSDAAPRRVVRAVDAIVAETDVVSKTEHERDPGTVGAFRSDLEDALTDKQLQVLRTAYFSEYFASPRGSSSAELAAALDVTGPTVLYHLRRAQRKLLASFFQTGPSEQS